MVRYLPVVSGKDLSSCKGEKSRLSGKNKKGLFFLGDIGGKIQLRRVAMPPVRLIMLSVLWADEKMALAPTAYKILRLVLVFVGSSRS